MKRTSLNQSDDSRPSDRAHARPRKAARTNEPKSLTNKSDAEEPNASSPLNIPTTPEPSFDLQEVIAAIKNHFDEQRAEMKSFLEEQRASLEAFQDEFLKRQESQNAKIKALKQTVEELSKAIEPSNKQSQAPHVGTSLAERDTRQYLQGETDGEAVSGQTIASRLATTESEESTDPPQPTYPMYRDGKIILQLPPGWEPPIECPPPGPKKSRLSVRGSKISRHPLADSSVVPPHQSATERAIDQAHGSNNDTKNDT